MRYFRRILCLVLAMLLLCGNALAAIGDLDSFAEKNIPGKSTEVPSERTKGSGGKRPGHGGGKRPAATQEPAEYEKEPAAEPEWTEQDAFVVLRNLSVQHNDAPAVPLTGKEAMLSVTIFGTLYGASFTVQDEDALKVPDFMINALWNGESLRLQLPGTEEVLEFSGEALEGMKAGVPAVQTAEMPLQLQILNDMLNEMADGAEYSVEEAAGKLLAVYDSRLEDTADEIILDALQNMTEDTIPWSFHGMEDHVLDADRQQLQFTAEHVERLTAAMLESISAAYETDPLPMLNAQLAAHGLNGDAQTLEEAVHTLMNGMRPGILAAVYGAMDEGSCMQLQLLDGAKPQLELWFQTRWGEDETEILRYDEFGCQQYDEARTGAVLQIVRTLNDDDTPFVLTIRNADGQLRISGEAGMPAVVHASGSDALPYGMQMLMEAETVSADAAKLQECLGKLPDALKTAVPELMP